MAREVVQTQCCVAGGGPAGLMLALLLARSGVDVVVLEKHADFFRDFRGDTIHPSTLDLLDQLGLRDRFDVIPHTDFTTLDLVVNGNRLTPADFRYLPGRNRHVALMPQWDFLNLLADEAKRYPTFRLVMDAQVTDLIHAESTATSREPAGDPARVTGVVATTPDGELQVDAALTVGADGRDSTVRRTAGMIPREYGVSIDVLWFRLPIPAVRPPNTLGYLNSESMVVTIPRTEYYQAGMLIPKGGYTAIQAAGIPEFRARIIRTAAPLASVVDSITSWEQIRILNVQINRLRRWWLPGLLCIGDAAHAMSPAFGVGVNYAIQDAVAAARLLARPLREGNVSPLVLKRVQRRRALPVRLMQPIQLTLHRAIAHPGGGGFLSNPMTRRQRVLVAVLLPVIRRLLPRLVGRGFRPERLTGDLLNPVPTATAVGAETAAHPAPPGWQDQAVSGEL